MGQEEESRILLLWNLPSPGSHSIGTTMASVTEQGRTPDSVFLQKRL